MNTELMLFFEMTDFLIELHIDTRPLNQILKKNGDLHETQLDFVKKFEEFFIFERNYVGSSWFWLEEDQCILNNSCSVACKWLLTPITLNFHELFTRQSGKLEIFSILDSFYEEFGL